MIRRLPAGFVLGAAAPAQQGEDVTTAPHTWDFYTHYRDDIKRCQKFHIKALNISLAWMRIIKDEKGTVDEAGIRQYRTLFEECLAHGIEPYVTLYAFDTPSPLAESEWLAPRTVEQFLRYARVCFDAFGDIVKVWITMKSPVSHVVQAYVSGDCLSISLAIHALHKMLIAHSRTVMLYKSMNLGGGIGIVHRAEAVYPLADSAANEKAAFLDDAFSNRFLLDAVLLGSYSAKTLQAINEILRRDNDSFAPAHEELACLREAAARMDFFGVSYYASHLCEQFPASAQDRRRTGNGGETDSYVLPGISRRLGWADVPETDWDGAIFPHGLYDMLLRIHEEYPPKPLYIMENGLGQKETLPSLAAGTERMVEDDNRIDYIRQHLDAVLAAMEEGVDVRGYFVWSLLDTGSGSADCEERYGLFFVDFGNQKRYPKKSAYWYRDLVQHRLMLTIEPKSGNMLSY